MEKITVNTTQHVTVEYELASIGDRIIAYLLDGLVMGAYAIAVILLNVAINFSLPKVLMVLVFLPLMFYHLISEIWLNGQSIGKRARDIKVIKLDGSSPSVGDYLLRWIMRLIDISIFSGVVAIVVIAVNGKGQRIGDIAAGTTVIKLRPKTRSVESILPDYEEDYQVRFPQVELLTDEDIALAKKLMRQAQKNNNYNLLSALADRIKEVTGIETDLSDWEFMKTVVRDYQYLTSR